jgi:integrase
MIQLPNGCYCSKLSVHPKNWNTIIASTKCTWYISYRFYDPRILTAGKCKGRLIIIKGMNHLDDLKDRQGAVKSLIENELELLKLRGLNRITGEFTIEDDKEITEFSLLAEALTWAFKELKTSKETLLNVKSCLARVKTAIIDQNLHTVMLKDFKTKHVRKILKHCAGQHNLSAHSFNHYRSYLIMLFKVLLEVDAVDYNPVSNISKQKPVKRLRNLLTPAERKSISDHFKNTDIYYYRFLQCFFHSGARPVELLRLKKEDINLENMNCKVVIKKGMLCEEQLRLIKDIAFEFWQAQYNECAAGDYLFGYMLKPGKKKCTRDYITKKWQREVKGDLKINKDGTLKTNKKDCLKINKDLYSLKHLNLDETAALLNADDASKMAGHTSTVITLKHYLVNEKDRQNERLKKVNNSFS